MMTGVETVRILNYQAFPDFAPGQEKTPPWAGEPPPDWLATQFVGLELEVLARLMEGEFSILPDDLITALRNQNP